MKEEKIAKSYAQALLLLGDERKLKVTEEFVAFNELINQSEDLENLLFLEVFSVEEKRNVLKDVLSEMKLSEVTVHFIFFLLNERRIYLLPLIFKEVVVLDDYRKGFLRGVVEGENEPETSVLNKLKEYFSKKLGKEILLSYQKRDDLTAGYRATVEGMQVDVSVDHQLENLKKEILH